MPQPYEYKKEGGYIFGGQAATLPPSPTTGPQPISVTGLQTPQTPLNIPPQQPEPDYNAALSSISDFISASNETAATTPATPAERTQQTISDRLLSAYQKLTGKQAAQSQAEQTAGLPAFQSQLTDINGQIQALTKEAAAIPLQIQQDFTGRGVTAAGVAPIQTAQLRNNAIKALGLSSIAQTLQGNIATAQATADRAVELQFAQPQAEIDFLSKAYEINKDQLSREDKKRADALNIRLTERQRLLDNAKEDKKVTLSFVAEAAKNGAPSVLLNQAINLPPQVALSTLQQFMSDPQAKQAALLDMDYRRQQIAASKAGIALDQQRFALDKRKIEADVALTNAQRQKVLSEASPPDTSAATVRLQEALSLAQSLRTDDAVGKKSAIGASPAKLIPFGQALGLQGNRVAFEAKVNTLKSNLTLDNLKLLKGAMSDKDLLFLNSVGSSLDINMTEKQFNSEIDRIITKLQGGAPDTQTVNGVVYKKAADGLYYPE